MILTLFRDVKIPNGNMINQAKKNKPARKPQLKKPKPLPDSLRNVERDSVYKILHPYEFN